MSTLGSSLLFSSFHSIPLFHDFLDYNCHYSSEKLRMKYLTHRKTKKPELVRSNTFRRGAQVNIGFSCYRKQLMQEKRSKKIKKDRKQGHVTVSVRWLLY